MLSFRPPGIAEEKEKKCRGCFGLFRAVSSECFHFAHSPELQKKKRAQWLFRAVSGDWQTGSVGVIKKKQVGLIGQTWGVARKGWMRRAFGQMGGGGT